MSRAITHTNSFEERLQKAAQDLKAQAEKLKPGTKRDDLLKKASQFEAAAEISEWLSVPGQAPT